jgi:hypothetical protein
LCFVGGWYAVKMGVRWMLGVGMWSRMEGVVMQKANIPRANPATFQKGVNAVGLTLK